MVGYFIVFRQKTAYEMRISDWSSDVCSSDLQDFAGISTPWVVGEWVFVVTDDAKLICLSSSSGKIRWLHQLRHYKNEKKSKGLIVWTGPVLAGNRLILAKIGRAHV